MKQTIEGFITYMPARWSGESEYHFQVIEMPEYGYITVMPYSIEVDIPDDFDPREQQIEILKDKKSGLMVELQCKINAIDDQISKLTAIGCEVAA